MKKTLILCILFIIIGYILGKKIEIKKSIPEKFYFLQEDILQDEKNIENKKELSKKVLEYRNNEIVVYIGITKDLQIAKKIKNLYQENKIPLQIEEVWLKNDEFRINIEQLDLLAQKTSNFDEITKIEEVALASYEEILKPRE